MAATISNPDRQHKLTTATSLSRYDIADYLAVSVETASRSLTDLKHRGGGARAPGLAGAPEAP
jgi:CRP-like cAMP-binding protein